MKKKKHPDIYKRSQWTGQRFIFAIKVNHIISFLCESWDSLIAISKCNKFAISKTKHNLLLQEEGEIGSRIRDRKSAPVL